MKIFMIFMYVVTFVLLLIFGIAGAEHIGGKETSVFIWICLLFALINMGIFSYFTTRAIKHEGV